MGDPATILAEAGYPDLLPTELGARPDKLVIDGSEARLAWRDLSLTIRPLDDNAITSRKLVTDDDTVERLLLADGSPALWIPPGHVILRNGTASAAEGVLLWTAQNHEYRLEGASDHTTAVAIADSMG
ncbi:MAG: hypothetical protein AAGA90_05890 [Actinomycetota bacterium]